MRFSTTTITKARWHRALPLVLVATLMACGGEDGESTDGAAASGASGMTGATGTSSSSSASGTGGGATSGGATSSGSGGSPSGAGGSDAMSGGGQTSAMTGTGSGGESGMNGGAGGAGTGGAGASGPVSISDLGTSCDQDGQCPDGLTPIEFCGIAGCEATRFCTCEIPCSEADDSCPGGTQCSTVSDGPGQVCVRKSCMQATDCEDSICCGQCGSQSCAGQCSDGPSCETGMQL